MPSPFPGMNPYLEGYLWADVHYALANKIRQQLAPKIQLSYTVRLEVDFVQDTALENEIGILYPDGEVLEVAKAFFAQAYEVVEQAPERVATDGHTSHPRAIEEELGEGVEREVRACRGSPIEQSHRGIKQRHYPILGFGVFESAQRYTLEAVPISRKRESFVEQIHEF